MNRKYARKGTTYIIMYYINEALLDYGKDKEENNI